MIIKIEHNILSTNNMIALNKLLSLIVYNNRHHIFVELPSAAKRNDFWNAFPVLIGYKEIIEQSFNKFDSLPKPKKKFSLVISTNNSENEFNIEDAIIYLQEPFEIILENKQNDGRVINAFIKHFDKKGLLKKHKDEKWLSYGNGGGGTLIDYIYSELREFRVFPKSNHTYYRAFVIIDSDLKYPEDTLSDSKKELEKKLKELSIPYHILKKREIENYLPDETFNSLVDSDYKEFVRAYLRFNKPEQKDYFDIENGFNSKSKSRNFEQLDEEIKKLYEEIEEVDKKLFLKKGLRYFYSDKKLSFKKEFPKLFNHHTVTKEALLKRCQHHEGGKNDIHGPNELPNLLTKIAELL